MPVNLDTTNEVRGGVEWETRIGGSWGNMHLVVSSWIAFLREVASGFPPLCKQTRANVLGTCDVICVIADSHRWLKMYHRQMTPSP